MRAGSGIYLLIFSAMLVACSEKESSSIELSGLNYTDVAISAFSVNGYYGHSIFSNGGGGKFVCCVSIPKKWRTGMKVTVRWTEDDRLPNAWKERTVDVPKYTKQDIGAFAVHFYPGDVVQVLVTMKLEGHPEYPYPRPEKIYNNGHQSSSFQSLWSHVPVPMTQLSRYLD